MPIPTTSILDGMTDADLRAALATAQKALIDLSVGAKPVSVAYTQGNGSRSVTYSKTEIPQINALIYAIQTKLGISPGRRPIRFRF